MLFYKGAIIRQFPWLLEPNKALDTGDFIQSKFSPDIYGTSNQGLSGITHHPVIFYYALY